MIFDFQAHGEQGRDRGLPWFSVRETKVAMPPVTGSASDVVAVFSQGVEGHPERFAQPNPGAVFGVAVMGGRGYESGVVFTQGVQVDVHESFQAGLVA